MLLLLLLRGGGEGGGVFFCARPHFPFPVWPREPLMLLLANDPLPSVLAWHSEPAESSGIATTKVLSRF